MLVTGLLPVFLLGRGNFVGAIGRLADQVPLDKVAAGLLHLGIKRICIHRRVQNHCHIAFGGRDLIDELQQADRLGHWYRQRMAGLGGDVADLVAVLGINVVALQVVDPIQRYQCAHWLVGKTTLGIGE